MPEYLYSEMKRIIFLFLLLVFCRCSNKDNEDIIAACNYYKDYFVYPAADSCNIYSSPDSNGTVVGCLKSGGLQYLGLSTWGMYEVLFKGDRCYVNRNEDAVIIHGNPNDSRLVYYVSIGGGRTFEEALRVEEELSNKDMESPIFVTMAYDRNLEEMVQVYRICGAAYYSEEDAIKAVQWYKQFDIDAFVWTSVGQAKCIYQTFNMAAYPEVVFPHEAADSLEYRKWR